MLEERRVFERKLRDKLQEKLDRGQISYGRYLFVLALGQLLSYLVLGLGAALYALYTLLK